MLWVKNRFVLLLTLLISTVGSVIFNHISAKEGMWIPATLKPHESELKKMGLQIPLDQVYNESGTALNNAVVLFGKGCTGEIISSTGLVLTNHHCGYGTVQGLTAPDKDYFAYGFFAGSRAEEIPCGGLTVTFIRKMENVTDKILPGLPDTLNDVARDSIIKFRISGLERSFELQTGMDAAIASYFEGNQYWVAITQTYTDIRLVGFPPNGIGAFGGDDENWAWPRHTGDFSLFRVYAGADNKPAPYSPANQPYKADLSLKINISGYKEGDFTMVYGFPGTTMEYITSYELNQVCNITDPISVNARTARLKVWSEHMDASRDIFLKYTAKRAGVANGWKKWKGELVGLKLNHAVEKKLAEEAQFNTWVKQDTAPYATSLLPGLKEVMHSTDSLLYQEINIRECVLATEVIQQGVALEKWVACFHAGLSDAKLTDTLQSLAKGMAWFYKNYDMATDKDVFAMLLPMYMKNCGNTAPGYYKKEWAQYQKNGKLWADQVYKNTVLASKERLDSFAAHARNADSSTLLHDPAWQLYQSIATLRKEKITPQLEASRAKKRYYKRLYLKVRMLHDTTRQFYPDANLTQRVAFGKVAGLDPDGPPKYCYQTTLKDVIECDDPKKATFKVPERLKELYKARDFGRWEEKGNVPVAFVADNHTAGGNSGSPVLNGRGELIGLNFDRPYEGTMSDYLFDPKRCRNISVDMRYVLFVIEKFGKAGWVIDELNIVK